jgi:hypothetical protein
LGGDEEVDYGKTPAKRMKMMDSEEEEEGNWRLLSKFSEFKSVAYFRNLSDPFRLICHAVRMSEEMCI